MKEQIYTLADLQAMANDDLNALAAELRGLKRIGGDNGGGDWLDEFDDFYDEVFIPTTDRNQSGELLQWAAEQKDAVFSIHVENNFKRVDVGVPDLMTQDASGRMLFDREFTIEGNDARAETIAFIAVMLAMAGRLV